MRTKWELYRKLFISTFLISAFTIGGGYVIVPLLKAKFVDEYKWLTEEESLTLVAIAQSAPGVIAVNAAVILGYRLGKIGGLITTLIATVLPPLITLSLIAHFYSIIVHYEYSKMILIGLQCGATAIMVNVFIDLVRSELNKRNILSLFVVMLTFCGNYFFDVNIVYLMMISGVVGLLSHRFCDVIKGGR